MKNEIDGVMKVVQLLLALVIIETIPQSVLAPSICPLGLPEHAFKLSSALLQRGTPITFLVINFESVLAIRRIKI